MVFKATEPIIYEINELNAIENLKLNSEEYDLIGQEFFIWQV